MTTVEMRSSKPQYAADVEASESSSSEGYQLAQPRMEVCRQKFLYCYSQSDQVL